eukprot:3624013-Alexandrium_andersonii.AAC.1
MVRREFTRRRGSQGAAARGRVQKPQGRGHAEAAFQPRVSPAEVNQGLVRDRAEHCRSAHTGWRSRDPSDRRDAGV